MDSKNEPENAAAVASSNQGASPVERCIWALLAVSMVAGVCATITLPFGSGWHHPSAWLVVTAASAFLAMAFLDQPRRAKMSRRYQYFSFIAFVWIIAVAAIQLIVASVQQ